MNRILAWQQGAREETEGRLLKHLVAMQSVATASVTGQISQP